MCLAVVKKFKETSTKVRRANILPKADADGPNWKDQDIADTFFYTRQYVENLCKRLVTEGFEIALHGKKRETPSVAKKLDGEQEAKVIALWLLARRLETISTPKHGSWLHAAENENCRL